MVGPCNWVPPAKNPDFSWPTETIEVIKELAPSLDFNGIPVSEIVDFSDSANHCGGWVDTWMTTNGTDTSCQDCDTTVGFQKYPQLPPSLQGTLTVDNSASVDSTWTLQSFVSLIIGVFDDTNALQATWSVEFITKTLFTSEYLKLVVNPKIGSEDVLVKQVEQLNESSAEVQYHETSYDDFDVQYLFIKDVYDF